MKNWKRRELYKATFPPTCGWGGKQLNRLQPDCL